MRRAAVAVKLARRVASTTSTASTAAASSKSLLLTTAGEGLPLLTKTAVNNPHANVGTWILATAGLVVGMIHVGGITRLTQSGLSMTSWSPLGSKPPMNQEEWLAEFDRYKQFPEWQQRQSMTLSEFQFIYAWEYGHRMLGRMIGVAFALPWLYFTVRGKIPKGYQPRMVGLLAMGGTQGLVGWWMVKSGLGDDRRGDAKEIRVRPVRLATHLAMAVATYSALVWTGLDLWSLPHHTTQQQSSKQMKALSQQLQQLSKQQALKQVSRLRTASLGLCGLTFTTIVSGALVAGNDAGRAYNTWPHMEHDEEHWMFPPLSVLTELEPWYRNVIDNTAMVQLHHRTLGEVTALTGLGIYFFATSSGLAAALTPQARVGLYGVGLATTGQFALGVTTLLTCAPLPLAAAHQLGSLVVLTSSLYLAHALRYAKPATLQRLLKGAARIQQQAAAK